MKLFFGISFALVILIQGCQKPGYLEDVNQFSASNDTLVIRMERVKGTGLFTFGAGPLSFIDTAELFQYPVTYPNDILDIKATQMAPDFKSIETDFIDIMRGLKDNEEIFIVDQNNNQDFTDDPVRPLHQIDWYSSEKPIKCEYLIFNGQEIVEDSSWVRIGTSSGRAMYGRDDHLTADFSLNENQYTIGITDQVLASAFNYGLNPEIALITENSNNKDTLLRKDLIKRGEYLDLNGSHYRFDSITNDGKYITLVKEVDFEKMVGTQIGMIAPDFDCVSVEGDTISSSNLQDKPIVLANSCGCGGDELSSDAFDDLKETFGNKIFALRLDSKITSGLEGWHIDMEEAYNKDIYIKYRHTYCSRIAYVIGIDRRIVDKFDIVNWESYLPTHISN